MLAALLRMGEDDLSATMSTTTPLPDDLLGAPSSSSAAAADVFGEFLAPLSAAHQAAAPTSAAAPRAMYWMAPPPSSSAAPGPPLSLAAAFEALLPALPGLPPSAHHHHHHPPQPALAFPGGPPFFEPALFPFGAAPFVPGVGGGGSAPQQPPAALLPPPLPEFTSLHHHHPPPHRPALPAAAGAGALPMTCSHGSPLRLNVDKLFALELVSGVRTRRSRNQLEVTEHNSSELRFTSPGSSVVFRLRGPGNSLLTGVTLDPAKRSPSRAIDSGFAFRLRINGCVRSLQKRLVTMTIEHHIRGTTPAVYRGQIELELHSKNVFAHSTTAPPVVFSTTGGPAASAASTLVSGAEHLLADSGAAASALHSPSDSHRSFSPSSSGPTRRTKSRTSRARVHSQP